MKAVVLKKGKEGIIRNRHHWIFSGAIASYEEGYQDGMLAAIHSQEGKTLAYGFFNRKVSLAGRVVVFGAEEPYGVLKKQIRRALALRSDLIANRETTAYRLINGEGDGFPGLIIDFYAGYLVTQTGALGMRYLLPFILDEIRTLLPIKGIYDKSSGGSLQEEGMEPREEVLWGHVPPTVDIVENGICYRISIQEGQKTGFFLDQREMRRWMMELASGKKVLNAFSYTGGFTLSALRGGALAVDSVDISARALEGCQENLLLNNYPHHPLYQEDVFAFLTDNPLHYDLVILDPPAFAKKKKDIPTACKGYKRLFKLAFQKMPSPSYLLLSSCSHYITETLFEEMVRLAALETHRVISVIGRHRLACDHPINPFHPESAYLKSLLLFIS